MAVALLEADVAGMLEVLHEAAVVDGPDAFTEPVVDAVVRLLRVDGGACCNVFAGRDPRIPAEQLTVVEYEAVGAEWIRQGSASWRIPPIPAEQLTVVDFAFTGAEWVQGQRSGGRSSWSRSACTAPRRSRFPRSPS